MAVWLQCRLPLSAATAAAAAAHFEVLESREMKAKMTALQLQLFFVFFFFKNSFKWIHPTISRCLSKNCQRPLEKQTCALTAAVGVFFYVFLKYIYMYVCVCVCVPARAAESGLQIVAACVWGFFCFFSLDWPGTVPARQPQKCSTLLGQWGRQTLQQQTSRMVGSCQSQIRL